MRKTGQEIEGHFYKWLKEANIVRGMVFRAGTRPFDRVDEDVVVIHLSGIDGVGGFHQSGVVVVNIHIPDIAMGDNYLSRDVERIGELERAMTTLVDNYHAGAFLIKRDSVAEIIKDEREHIVSFRIKYKYNTTE